MRLLFASTATREWFWLSATLITTACAKKNKKYWNKTIAIANFFNYVIYATATATADQQNDYKQPQIRVVVRKAQTIHHNSISP